MASRKAATFPSLTKDSTKDSRVVATKTLRVCRPQNFEDEGAPAGKTAARPTLVNAFNYLIYFGLVPA